MFHLHIATPEKILFDGDSDYVSLPTDDGIQVILPHHEPYIAAIELGEVIFQDNNGKKHPYAVSGGFLEVNKEDVYILLSTALHAKEIDIQAAEEAKKRAEKLIKEMTAKEDLRTLQAQIKLANLHITTARKYRGDIHQKLDDISSGNL